MGGLSGTFLDRLRQCPPNVALGDGVAGCDPPYAT